MTRRRKPVAAAALTAAVFGLTAGLAGISPAIAADRGSLPAGTDFSERMGLVAWEGDTSAFPVREGAADDDGMPQSISDGIWAMELNERPPVNTYEWDAENASLLIYADPKSADWDGLLEQYLPGERVELVPAVNGKARVDEVMDAVVRRGGALDDDSRIVYALPKKDGSLITVGVETAGDLPDARSLQEVLGTKIALAIEHARDVRPVGRNDSNTTAQLAGNQMSTAHVDPGYINLCSTGFLVGNFSTSAPGMLSAEHCARDKPSITWYYTTSMTSARLLGSYSGYLHSSWAETDTGLWTGGNVDRLIPAVFTGSHTDISTGEWIRGGNYPAVGTDVCYSGGRSGNVCSNEVLFQGLTICFSVVQCYQGQTWTSQRSGIEAAGQGDSGGPVYQMVSGKAMASGVISGIVGGSTTCTGDGGGRLCSPVALFAPIVGAVGSGSGWGLAYIP